MADTNAQSESSEAETSEDFEVLHLSTKDKADPVEKVTLFEIDDVPYQVPRHPSPTVGLKFLKILRTQGQQAAAGYILEAMLGEEGYEALMNYEQLTDDQFNFVLSAASRIATGKTERPKGKSSRRNGTSGRRS